MYVHHRSDAASSQSTVNVRIFHAYARNINMYVIFRPLIDRVQLSLMGGVEQRQAGTGAFPDNP